MVLVRKNDRIVKNASVKVCLFLSKNAPFFSQTLQRFGKVVKFDNSDISRKFLFDVFCF